ncbi:MAG: hypothetical protein LC679_16800 [Intrasporangiaceae bacterium]|nr:hypothetical protein [Intrasporangiaceae bacterium]
MLIDDVVGPILLVWAEESVSWNPEELLVEFYSHLEDEAVEASVGDRVTIGGGEGVGPDAAWVNEPSCEEIDRMAGVSSLERLGPGGETGG